MIERQTDNHAMTEVALGLAMAFFAMMILAMVSMQSGASKIDSSYSGASQEHLEKTVMSGLVEGVQVSANQEPMSSTEPGSPTVKNAIIPVDSQDVFIIFYQGRYLDKNLNPILLEQLSDSGGAARYILALSSKLSFEAVVAARTPISVSNLIITTLDQAWLKRLAL